MKSIKKVIKSEREKWIKSDYFNINSVSDINNGKCSQFAKSVKDSMGRPKDLRILSYGYNSSGYRSNAHKWIYYNNEHYDAECPEGVKEPKNLPIFRRNEIEPDVETY